jgi:sec-independent protein translocase protein TatC
MPTETEEQTDAAAADTSPSTGPDTVTPDYATPRGKRVKHGNFDPDEFRMTLGEHLEELRWRLMLGLGAFFPIAFVCLVFGRHLVTWFISPLMHALQRNHLPTAVYFTEMAESFMVYIQVSLIVAAVIASPWGLYQLWQFVAAGLYPKERKYVTKYLPLSIGLLVGGMLFFYYVVLPLTLDVFLAFTIAAPIEFSPSHPVDVPPGAVPMFPVFDGDPAHPVDGMIWINRATERLNVCFQGSTRSIPLLANAQVTPQITLQKYIMMVVQMLIAFGVAFQLPLVVLALVRMGIVDIPQLKSMRKYVFFIIMVISAFIVPEMVTGMVALALPLYTLFELGLWLAREPKNKRAIENGD